MAVMTPAASNSRIPTMAKHALAKRLGTEHLRRLAPELKALNLGPDGFVVVDIETGIYVTGEKRSVASQRWRELPSRTIGWGSFIRDIE